MRLTGTLKWPEGYKRQRYSYHCWDVYKVPQARLTPTEDRVLGQLEVVFVGRLARLRSWIYVTFAKVRS